MSRRTHAEQYVGLRIPAEQIRSPQVLSCGSKCPLDLTHKFCSRCGDSMERHLAQRLSFEKVSASLHEEYGLFEESPESVVLEEHEKFPFVFRGIDQEGESWECTHYLIGFLIGGVGEDHNLQANADLSKVSDRGLALRGFLTYHGVEFDTIEVGITMTFH